MRYFLILYNDLTEHFIVKEMHPIVASLPSHNPDLEIGAIHIDKKYEDVGGRDWSAIMEAENAAEALRKFTEVMGLE